MPTGHELGSEGREQGGGGGLPTGHDVPRQATVGVRLRSVVAVPACWTLVIDSSQLPM